MASIATLSEKCEVLYGPIELGGRHLYVEQGVGQIGLFLKHWLASEFDGGLIAEDYVWVVSSASGNILYVIEKSSHTLTTSRIEVASVVTRIPCIHRVPLTTG